MVVAEWAASVSKEISPKHSPARTTGAGDAPPGVAISTAPPRRMCISPGLTYADPDRLAGLRGDDRAGASG